MKRYYEIADLKLCISGNEEEMYTDEQKLAPFTAQAGVCNYNLNFTLCENLEKSEGVCVYQDANQKIFQHGEAEIRYVGAVQKDLREAYLRREKQGSEINVQVRRSNVRNKISVKTILNSLGLERLILERKALILHASYIVWNERAILFTAPSGVGKSTQANLWSELRGAEIINGDRAILQVRDDNVYACGLPFAGSSQFCKNRTVPIAAVVYLGQAKENHIERLSAGKAFRRIWEGCSIALWSQADVEKSVEILQEIVFKVPVFHLRCTPDGRAVEALLDAMKENEYEE